MARPPTSQRVGAAQRDQGAHSSVRRRQVRQLVGAAAKTAVGVLSGEGDDGTCCNRCSRASIIKTASVNLALGWLHKLAACMLSCRHVACGCWQRTLMGRWAQQLARSAHLAAG
jgi:hypothetical protein